MYDSTVIRSISYIKYFDEFKLHNLPFINHDNIYEQYKITVYRSLLSILY